MRTINELYKKSYDILKSKHNKIKNVCTFKEFRSKVSSVSVGLIICNPLDYYKTLLGSSVQKESCELIFEYFKELVKYDDRLDLAEYFDRNSNKIEELIFKKDAQKYFTIIKNTLNLESFEVNHNGK